MRSFLTKVLAFAATASAHTIFQRVSVNGKDQGYLTGVRSPATNNPIYDPTRASIACNTGLNSPVSSAVINLNAGDAVGSYWEHILGGPQGSNDPDNPIASSHKGPVMAYLAKVDNAATASGSGLSWFKISEDNLDLSTGLWGVDHMIANKGWSNFTIPSCVAAGQYLLRVDLLALHSAYSQGGSQFYLSCANVNIASSGTLQPQTVSFPGAYTQTDPSILINIYGATGKPDNGGKAYLGPGPRPITC